MSAGTGDPTTIAIGLGYDTKCEKLGETELVAILLSSISLSRTRRPSVAPDCLCLSALSFERIIVVPTQSNAVRFRDGITRRARTDFG